MSFNFSGQRSFVISDPYDTNTAYESFSSRPHNTPNYLHNISSRDLTTNEAYYPYDDRLTDAMRKFKGPVSGEYSQNIEEETSANSYYSRRSVQSDADDLFDNFDKCYQARFPTNKGSVTANSHLGEPKAKPICRDLFQELNSNTPKGNSVLNKKLPANSGTRTLQKPKEFHTLKADKYFNVRASSNLHSSSRPVREEDKHKHIREDKHKEIPLGVQPTNRSASISNLKNENSRHYYEARPTHRDEENVENENEETRHRGVKNFMFVQNAAFSKIDNNYEAVQRTLNKIRRRDHRDASGDWAILNDITNHVEKQTRRGSVRETGEYRRTADLSNKRRTHEKEIEEHQRASVSYNNDLKKRINVSDMIASYHSKENSHPTVRNSYNGKNYERSRSKEAGKVQTKGVIERPTAGYMKEAENKTKRASGMIERKSAKPEEPMTTYQALMKYYELAKRGSSKGGDTTSGPRSTSAHRW